MQQRQGFSAREIARRSEIFAEALGRPHEAFTHRAVSAWLNGTRNPKLEHRRLLAIVLGVGLEELNHALDDPFDTARAASIVRTVGVRVIGQDRAFEYRLTIRGDLDLSRPAIYRHWADMFLPWPAVLVRHFGRSKHNVYGWIPSATTKESLGALVPLDTRQTKLERTGSLEQHTWFVYLPGRILEVGDATREGRWLMFRKHDAVERRRYPMSRSDLVGRVIGKPLFVILESGLS